MLLSAETGLRSTNVPESTPNTRMVNAMRLHGFGDVYWPEHGLVREGEVISMPEDEALARSDFRVTGQTADTEPTTPAEVQTAPAVANADNTDVVPEPDTEPEPEPQSEPEQSEPEPEMQEPEPSYEPALQDMED